ncbi:hypothetical protein DFH09DRAFT_1278689 [Mycena vulgaris]|nr:hypothetical protein DFH09DRAFT_1278689 [Mycena vulgaris]
MPDTTNPALLTPTRSVACHCRPHMDNELKHDDYVPTSQPLEDGEDENPPVDWHHRTSCQVCNDMRHPSESAVYRSLSLSPDSKYYAARKIRTALLVRRAPPVKFGAALASVKTPARTRIPLLQLVRRVTSAGPVKRFYFRRAASGVLKAILAAEAIIARMRIRHMKLVRKARGKENK